jgi:hypothetical protein
VRGRAWRGLKHMKARNNAANVTTQKNAIRVWLPEGTTQLAKIRGQTVEDYLSDLVKLDTEQSPAESCYDPKATVPVRAEIGAHQYGLLVAASKVHKLSIEDTLARYLDSSVVDWANDNFAIDR